MTLVRSLTKKKQRKCCYKKVWDLQNKKSLRSSKEKKRKGKRDVLLSTDKNVNRIRTISNQDKFSEIATIQKMHKLSTKHYHLGHKQILIITQFINQTKKCYLKKKNIFKIIILSRWNNNWERRLAPNCRYSIFQSIFE